MSYLTPEAVGALLALAKRNYPKDMYPGPITRGFWFDQRSYAVDNRDYFCFICCSNFSGPNSSSKLSFPKNNVVIKHGIKHLKEHGLLAFL